MHVTRCYLKPNQTQPPPPINTNACLQMHIACFAVVVNLTSKNLKALLPSNPGTPVGYSAPYSFTASLHSPQLESTEVKRRAVVRSWEGISRSDCFICGDAVKRVILLLILNLYYCVCVHAACESFMHQRSSCKCTHCHRHAAYNAKRHAVLWDIGQSREGASRVLQRKVPYISEDPPNMQMTCTVYGLSSQHVNVPFGILEGTICPPPCPPTGLPHQCCNCNHAWHGICMLLGCPGLPVFLVSRHRHSILVAGEASRARATYVRANWRARATAAAAPTLDVSVSAGIGEPAFTLMPEFSAKDQHICLLTCPFFYFFGFINVQIQWTQAVVEKALKSIGATP